MERIEARLREGPEPLSPAQCAELLDLLRTLKGEIAELSKTRQEQARSIEAFTHISAHEAIRTDKNARLLQTAIQGLRQSVEGVEESNPRLVQLANALASTLANMGI